jgi:hypothetical protein
MRTPLALARFMAALVRSLISLRSFLCQRRVNMEQKRVGVGAFTRDGDYSQIPAGASNAPGSYG